MSKENFYKNNTKYLFIERFNWTLRQDISYLCHSKKTRFFGLTCLTTIIAGFTKDLEFPLRNQHKINNSNENRFIEHIEWLSVWLNKLWRGGFLFVISIPKILPALVCKFYRTLSHKFSRQRVNSKKLEFILCLTY